MYLPRNAWQPEPVELGDSSPRRPDAELSASPNEFRTTAELPDRASPPRNAYSATVPNASELPVHRHRTTSSDAYIEDVEPRFAVNEPVLPLQQSTSLTRTPHDPAASIYAPEPVTTLDVPFRTDNRSPAQSDGSNFTSISQRQINPNWRPQPGMGQGMGQGMRGGPPTRRFEDSVLASNPDFTLPGTSAIARRPVGGGPSGGRRGGSRMGSDGLVRASQGSHQYYDGL